MSTSTPTPRVIVDPQYPPTTPTGTKTSLDTSTPPQIGTATSLDISNPGSPTNLPVTGMGLSVLFVGLLLVAVGVTLVLVTARRRSGRHS